MIGRYRDFSEWGPDQYLAHDPLLNRQVIVQFLPQACDEVFEWVRKLARAGGPLVQRLHDFGKEQDRSYLIRELVEGRSLAEIGPDPKLLPPMLAALDQIRKTGLQHGDLSPANAVLSSEGVLRLTNLCYQGRDDKEALAEVTAWFDVQGSLFK